MRITYKLTKYFITPVRRSLRTKLMIIILSVALVPHTVAMLISYQNSKNVMEQEILRQNQTKLDWVEKDFSDYASRIDESLTSFYFDNDLGFYEKRLSRPENQSESINYFNTKMRAYLLNNIRDFTTVSYYSFDNKKLFLVSFEQNFKTSNLKDDVLSTDPYLGEKEGLYYVIHEDTESIEGPFLTKYNYRFEDQKLVGALVVKLNWNLFERANELLNTEAGNSVFFLNGEGKLIYSGKQDDLSQEGKERLASVKKAISKRENDGYFLLDNQYVFYKKISDDLSLVKTIPTKVATSIYKKTLLTQSVILLLTGIIIVTISITIGRSLTKPMLKLTASMQDIQQWIESDELPVSQVRSMDEIKVLEQSFHFMIMKIRSLIDQEYKQKIANQTAQLMALQAQINPHFMYNTLQMIGAMAVESGNEAIYNIITAFSSMMRYNMQLSNELVTLKEELTNVKHYLKIQQSRFDRQIIVDYNINEEVDPYLVPKLSLQPIVENCFKHGFKNNDAIWQIKIAAYVEKKQLMVIVKDNGIGIDADRLSELRTMLEETGDRLLNEHLGLPNIESRIKLHFGNQYGIFVNSQQNSGFSVVLKMGLKGGGGFE